MAQKDLHALAVSAESAVEKLATGLAQAGAGDETVGAVEQIAEVLRNFVTTLGKGQENTADDEPPAPAEEEPAQPRSFDEASRQMMAERPR